jgi:regulator of sirC expression with transglutaminase-like and TPR domain
LESTFRERFGDLVAQPDDRVDLALASLLIAGLEYPALEIPRYLGQLEQLGDQARARTRAAPGGSHAALEAVNRLLFEELGFRGNSEDYYDPRNSYLNDVLDRRTGIPITLSTLYMEVAQRAGLEVEGVGLPGHFIVKVRLLEEEALLDPYYGGTLLSAADCQRRLDRIFAGRVRLRPELLAACSRKEILSRMLRNLKAIYAKAGDHARCLSVVDLLRRVDPASGEELRDRGLLYEALDCYGLALRDLEEYVARFPDSPEATELLEKMATLRGRAARLN